MRKIKIIIFEILLSKNKPNPLQFAIPECKIVHAILEKDWDFAYIISGQPERYIYNCGEDCHDCEMVRKLPNFFLRKFEEHLLKR